MKNEDIIKLTALLRTLKSELDIQGYSDSEVPADCLKLLQRMPTGLRPREWAVIKDGTALCFDKEDLLGKTESQINQLLSETPSATLWLKVEDTQSKELPAAKPYSKPAPATLKQAMPAPIFGKHD